MAARSVSIMRRASSSVRHVVNSRGMSTLATFPYVPDRPDPDTVTPLARNGLDPHLNWSLGDDGFTIGGDCWRNAPELALLQYSDGHVTKQRALASKQKLQGDAPMFATDNYPGYRLMDVDVAEALRDSVRDDMYARKRLFVEDGAVGSYRTSEIKVRVVTDSPDFALYCRNMLHRVPLKIPDSFPRHILIVANQGWTSGDKCIVADLDTEAEGATKAVVTAAGAISFSQIAQSIAHCASQLAAVGGYRHEFGGGVRAKIALENGRLPLFYDDTHWRADTNAPHPSMVVMSGTVIRNTKSGQYFVIVNSDSGFNAQFANVHKPQTSRTEPFGKSVGAAAASGKQQSKSNKQTKNKPNKETTQKPAPQQSSIHELYADMGFVWDESGLSRLWNAYSAPITALGGQDKVPRHGLITSDVAYSQFDAPQATLQHPQRIIVINSDASGDKSSTDYLASRNGFSEEQKEQLDKLMDASGAKIVVVKDQAAAIEAAQ